MQREQRYGALNDPEKKKTTHQNRHPFYRTLFESLKMIDDIFPHRGKSYEGKKR
jgi:hypothetical protein